MRIDYSSILVSDAATDLLTIILETLFYTAHIFCFWHIKKNIWIYILKCLRQHAIRHEMLVSEVTKWMNRIWNRMKSKIAAFFYVKIEKNLKIVWTVFKNAYYNLDYMQIVIYRRDQWISHKKKIMTIWVNKTLHYENRTIFRVKEFQKIIKILILNVIDHLRDVLNKLISCLNEKNRAIWIETQRLLFRFDYNYKMFNLETCQSVIFSYALNKVFEHKKLFNLNRITMLNACSNCFTAFMRLSCTHTIQKRLRVSESLMSENFHSQWYMRVKINFELIDYQFLLRDLERIILVERSRNSDREI